MESTFNTLSSLDIAWNNLLKSLKELHQVRKYLENEIPEPDIESSFVESKRNYDHFLQKSLNLSCDQLKKLTSTLVKNFRKDIINIIENLEMLTDKNNCWECKIDSICYKCRQNLEDCIISLAEITVSISR